jgi:hypothetical protein
VVVVVIVLAILLIIVVAVVLVRRRATDSVDSFRRQIEALSPEARRPTIGQVKAGDDDDPDEA